MHSAQDFQSLLDQNERLLIVTYRGDWCPFCRTYLKQVQKHLEGFRALNIQVHAVAADSEEKNAKFARKLKLQYDIISDPQLVLREMHQVPFADKHIKSKSYPAGAFLQPAVLIFEKGELKFVWRQDSKVLNMGGAVARMSVKEVLDTATELFPQ